MAPKAVPAAPVPRVPSAESRAWVRRSASSTCQAAATESAFTGGSGSASRWRRAKGADCALPRSGWPAPSSCDQSGASRRSRRWRTSVRSGSMWSGTSDSRALPGTVRAAASRHGSQR